MGCHVVGIPTTTRTVCPSRVAHGHVTPGCAATPGSSCSYTCNPGYESDPTRSVLICLGTGQWHVDVSMLCMGTHIDVIFPLPLYCTLTHMLILTVCFVSSNRRKQLSYWHDGVIDSCVIDGL
jgi:hypothetical protein